MEWTAGKGTTALGIIGTTLGGLAVAGAPLLGGMMGRGAAAVLKFICVPECTIYINLDALPGANLVEIYF